MRKQKRSRYSRRLRGISTTKRWRTRKQGGAEKKCLFINWGPKIGLGNQLCIYAAAVVLVKKIKNWNLCIPPAPHNPHAPTDYRFLFKQGRPVERTPDIQGRINVAKVVHKNKNVFFASWNPEDLVVNSGTNFKNTTKNLRMKSTEEPEVGYYQNYGSIEPALATIRPEINEELSKRYGSESLIKDPNSSAFIHIRYGDYKHINLVSPIDYFKNGRARLEKESTIQTIYLISDKSGIEWAKKEGLATSLELIDDTDELKVLYYMSQCKAGACISASTYSMWGAIMGPATNDSSTIIYPTQWNGTISGKNIGFPARWIML